MFKVESGVPMPRKSCKYPFVEMNVGDSFAFPDKDRNRVQAAAAAFGKDHGRKFSLRKLDGSGAVRVWRTK